MERVNFITTDCADHTLHREQHEFMVAKQHNEVDPALFEAQQLAMNAARVFAFGR